MANRNPTAAPAKRRSRRARPNADGGAAPKRAGAGAERDNAAGVERDNAAGAERDNAAGAQRETASERDELTIEQLAQETGMTVRNIRAHQSRGLLPPPTIRGRTGFYGHEHVTRLRLIGEMQADGFNLKAIDRLLSAGGAAADELLGFKRALTAPFEQESSEFLDDAELTARFGGEVNPRALSKAIKLGLLVPFGEGRYEVPSPTLLEAGEELMRLGVPVEATLRVFEQLSRHSDGVAEAFVKLFLEQLWRPFEQAGHPEERLPEVRRALERLRPLASEALLAVFQRNMTRAAEQAFGRELERGRQGRRRAD
jgi:DNA-binding transcriptional MerR regulator